MTLVEAAVGAIALLAIMCLILLLPAVSWADWRRRTAGGER